MNRISSKNNIQTLRTSINYLDFWFLIALIKMATESDSSVKMQDNLEVPELPKKRFYRQRAHANPLNDHTFE
jgi:hypothetical protein